MKIRQAKKIMKHQCVDYPSHKINGYWHKRWLNLYNNVLALSVHVKVDYRITQAITRIAQYEYKLTKNLKRRKENE